MPGREYYRIRYWLGKTLGGKNLGDLADIGCGHAPVIKDVPLTFKSYTKIDLKKKVNPDIVSDIEKEIPGSYDTILVVEVLEHVKHPKRVLKNIKKALRPNGLAIITTPFLILEHSEKGDYHRFTKDYWRKIPREMGFEVERLECRKPKDVSPLVSFSNKEFYLNTDEKNIYTGVNVILRRKGGNG